MKRLSSAAVGQAAATVLGALVVVAGAWRISTSIGRTRPPVMNPQRRVLSQQRSFTGAIDQLPTTAVMVPQSGAVSLVLALPGQPVVSGQALAELDREPLITQLIAIKTELLRRQAQGAGAHLALPRKSTGSSVDPLKQQEQHELNAIRSDIVQDQKQLDALSKQATDVSAHLTTASTPAGSGGTAAKTDLDDALSLVHSAVEGAVLSQTLTLADIRTFFGAGDKADSAFLNALSHPQDAVPYWEKLLEAERLKTLVDERIKASPEFANSQEALQVLLTSKSLTQMASDILSGLQTLLATVQPNDQLTQADLEALTRLLSRNTSSMTTLLQTLQIHEERVSTLLDQQAQVKEAQAQGDQQNRAQWAELATQKAKLLQGASQQIVATYASLEQLRQERSQALDTAMSSVLTQSSDAALKGLSISALHDRLQLLEQQLQQSVVRAPAAGVVTTLSLAVGDSVAAGESVAILSAHQPIIHVEVPEHLAASAGQFADVVVGAPPTPHHFAAVVQSVQYPDDHTTQLTVAVRSSDGFLDAVHDATATVGLTLTTPTPVLALPESTLVKDAQGQHIVVMDAKNSSSPKTIQTGFIGDDGWVEVTQGLNQQDRVVTEPMQ